MNNKDKTGGYVIIINTLIFISISTILAFGVINPIISSKESVKAFTSSKQSFLLANSASEEALYRLKHGIPISNSETLTLNSNTANINISDTESGKIVEVTSSADGFQRNIDVSVIQGVGVTFNYGLQSGEGGFLMSGGAHIIGNVYSNGDIVGNGGAYITGSANVANLIEPTAVLSNVGSFPASSELRFGGNTTEEDAAQSFELTQATDLTSIAIYIKKMNNDWMRDATVRITTDNNGEPSTNSLATGDIGATQVTTSHNFIEIPLSNTVTIDANTKYWIVFDSLKKTWNQYYSLAGETGAYSAGNSKAGVWSSQSNKNDWDNTSPSNLDIYFELFAGGDTGSISGIAVYGNAWAHEISDATVSGDMYCKASVSTNKVCDTTKSDPVPLPLPVSEGNIEEWKAVAAAGGTITGDLTLAADDQLFLGPKKIDGDLTVKAGSDLFVTGTLWVTGNIELIGGATITLDSSYGSASGIIVSDGVIDAGGSGQFGGSGTAGSYILVVSTSTCPDDPNCPGDDPYAIEMSGGAGAVILNAQYGTLKILGSGQAKQVTAKKIDMSGGASVVYEDGIADMSFTSQPSGTWNIIKWDEK